MPSNTKQARLMAKLYVHDPDIKGDWLACAHKAGYKNRPNPKNKGLMALIRKEGGIPPTESGYSIPKDGNSQSVRAPKELKSLHLLADLELGSVEDWQEKARMIAPIMNDIITGTITVKPAQWNAIKYVYEKAYGKGVTDETRINGVVILPALVDDLKSPTICPVCKNELEDAEDLNEYFAKSGKLQT